LSAPTVTGILGPIEAARLGLTLSHEHLFADGTAYLEQPEGDEAHTAARCSVSAETRPLIARYSCVNASNVMLDEPDVMTREAARFAAIGGSTIIDVTSEGIGRRPEELQAVARATGLNIVAGCGPYCEYTLTPTLAARAVDEIEAAILRDLAAGIDGTGIRAGVIGEIGVNGQPLGESRRTCLVTPVEERGLRAAARASRATGVPVVVHQPNVPDAVPVLTAILEQESLDPDMVCLGHMSSVLDLELHEEMIRRGYWIAYDNFGMNVENSYVTDATDERRVAWLAELLRRGLGHRILVSHDVWSKIQLSRYGGEGYTHLHKSILPWLRREGVTTAQIAQLTIGNPAAFFARSGVSP
jgi:phosphotriesterase-related protein